MLSTIFLKGKFNCVAVNKAASDRNLLITAQMQLQQLPSHEGPLPGLPVICQTLNLDMFALRITLPAPPSHVRGNAMKCIFHADPGQWPLVL